MTRNRVLLTILAVLIASTVMATPALGASADTLRRPAPDWFTPELQTQLKQNGANGVDVSAERMNTECPGYQDSGVGAAGCIVAPYGCTANFVYTDGTSYYIGTAGHCSDKVGDVLTMQVDTTTLADVGSVVKRTSQTIPGNDFSLVKLDPAVVSKWGVDPAIPVVGGPNGVYTGCGPETVRHYGHGYGVAVAQGKPEGGIATNWFNNSYGWTGVGLPGDSGSPVVTTDGKGAGNFTHLIVHTGYPGSDLAGMRLTAILQFAGVSLVNADGSTTAPPGPASCGTDPSWD